LLEIVNRGLTCLLGETSATGSMDGEGFSEQLFEAEGPPPVKAHYGAIKGILRFLFGDPAEALRITEAISPPPGVVFKVDYVFFHGMACVELARAAEPSEREALLAKAEADLACFEPWVRVASRNFSALQQLLKAELAAARHELAVAIEAFEHAIAAAASAGARHHLALAHERAGRFHHRENRTHAARLNLRAAFEEYELWGATGKLRQLTREFAELRVAEPGQRHFDSAAETIGGSSPSGGSRLDLESAMRAVSVIASEIRLEPLLRRLTQILLENAGATRGVLLLAEHGEFVIRAALRVQAEQVVDERSALELDQALAASVVRYCARTMSSVVLDDAARDNRFAQDPFVERLRAKSIACLPLIHQSQLVGVLYLENDAATGAFHGARVERLEFLAGHAAVSLQNARLYEELQAANDNLERRVQARTTELSERNQDMRRVLDNVKQGLLTIDLEGKLAPEHSRVVDEWLGPFEPQATLQTYLGRVDPRFVENFRLAFAQLLDGELPEELLLEQLPTALVHGARRFHVSYQPIYAHDKLAGLLVVIDEVTEALRRARDEAEQKDVLWLCQHLSKDRAALLGFFEENSGIVADLTQGAKVDASLRRNLHTLKGNAGMYGFMTLASACHAAEDAIAEDVFDASHLEAVAKSFAVLQGSLASIAGENAAERIEVPRATLRSLAEELAAGLPAKQAARKVERLLLEPAGPSLERLGRYGRALAARMGKAEPRVEVIDSGLLVDGRRAAPLFATLVHLIRNAIDHGMETRSERAAAGKAEPVLSLRASVEAGEAIITIQDDGRGVDWERVRERARERGLPASSKSELAAALFSDEFSTRDEATSISGRGVGLGAVQAEMTRLSGRVLVESEAGRGTTFRLFVAADALGIPRAD
jgi:HPt (histidine-containing phosphotransfer) domain-containing protein